MKIKNLLLLAILLLTFKVGHNQTSVYHPFPVKNAVWDHLATYTYGPPPHSSKTYRYLLQGDDIIINSITYHKLYSDFFSPNTFTYVGGIRESNKKVYFYSANNGERLLYDFSVTVGGTIMYKMGNPCKVTSIDAVLLLDGTYRKRYKASGQYIIEGIGSVEELLGGIVTCNSFKLLCFKDSLPLYKNPVGGSCLPSIVTGINETVSTDDLSVFPNPSSGKFTIKNEGGAIERFEVKIYNVLGEKVAPSNSPEGGEISSLPSGGQPQVANAAQWAIDISSQPNGVYFLHIKTEKESFSQKIVIQK